MRGERVLMKEYLVSLFLYVYLTNDTRKIGMSSFVVHPSKKWTKTNRVKIHNITLLLNWWQSHEGK